MTDYREIDALSKAPDRARTLARTLAGLVDVAWTDWEIDFLEALCDRRDALSTRQAEKLVELRDNSYRYETVSGYPLRPLLEACWQGRLELESEADIALIERLKASGERSFRKSNALRLRRCAVRLGILEPDTPWSFAASHRVG
jgi:hypothetical protein